MRIGLERRRRPTTAEIIIVGGTAASLLYAALLGQRAAWALGCHFRIFLCIECPTCGTTRVLLALLRGDLAAAVAQNPLVVGFVAAGAAVALNVLTMLAAGRAVVVEIPHRQQRLLLIVFFALLIANWAYVLAT